MTQHTKTTALASVRSADKALRDQQERLRAAVQVARQYEASWAEIGDVLGVSRQAAQERFSKEPRR